MHCFICAFYIYVLTFKVRELLIIVLCGTDVYGSIYRLRGIHLGLYNLISSTTLI